VRPRLEVLPLIGFSLDVTRNRVKDRWRGSKRPFPFNRRFDQPTPQVESAWAACQVARLAQ
jgi:hypothetical protein